MQYLPRQQEVAGWQLDSDPLVIMPDRLDQYMDRQAEYFRQYELADLTVGEYRRVDGAGFATVEIFRFPDFVKAFGAYSNRRKAVVNFLDIENESFVGPHSIQLWRGAFYVRVIGGGGPVGDAMKELTAAVAERMPKATGKPAVFSFLPETYRQVNSETFRATEALGNPLLGNSFNATYEVNGEQVEGLIIPAPSREAVAKLLEEYRAFFAANGRLLDPIPNLGEDNFTAEDRHMGRVVVFRLDRFLVVFRGYGNRQSLIDLSVGSAQRIFGTIRKQLVSAEKQAQAREQGTQPNRNTPPWQSDRE